MKFRNKAISAALMFACATVLSAQEASADLFYTAIRNNDVAALRALAKTKESVSVKDKRGTTPLMFAAAFGSVDSMKILLDAGADVNAANVFGATALMWGGGDLEKVRLLVAKGADVNARSKPGRTPLLIACAKSGGSEIVKLLLAKGADIALTDSMKTTPLLAATQADDPATIAMLLAKNVDVNAADAGGDTPLMNAAANGDVGVMKTLLAKGANVNAVSSARSGPGVKNGPIALGSFTPLLLTAAYGSPEPVKLLLDAGAKVDARDVRGMTPLMLAIASDHPDPRVVKLLLDRGADPKLKDANGESAIDWAKKFGYAPVLQALNAEAPRTEIQTASLKSPDRRADVKAAAQKSIDLLQRTSGSFFQNGGCVACHAQNLAGMTAAAARAKGLGVKESDLAEQAKSVRLQWASFDQMLVQRMDPPGGAEMIDYTLFQLAAAGAPPDFTTDAMIHNVAAQQRAEGNWHTGGVARPPMEDHDSSRTAMSLRVLRLYGPAGRKAEFDERIARAAAWLKGITPYTNEDRVMQLLGLKWAEADRATIDALRRKLVESQRPDGGWAQRPELASDAYATGQTLYALHECGVPANDPAYRAAVSYLLQTQLEDGSWHVKSRAPKFQPYFQSGFPHDHDQWISASATAWAAMGLIYSLDEKPAAIAEVRGAK